MRWELTDSHGIANPQIHQDKVSNGRCHDECAHMSHDEWKDKTYKHFGNPQQGGRSATQLEKTLQS